MKTFRFTAFLINAAGLLLSGYYFFTNSTSEGLWSAILVLYLVNLISTFQLARNLQRWPYGWSLVSLVLPFLIPLILTFLRPPAGEKMSYVDKAWARMDIPTNPMVVTGLMMFETPITYAQARAIMEERILQFKRFTQKVKHQGGVYYWEDAEDFSLDDHIISVEVPEPYGEKGLQKLVGQIMSKGMDPDKPLWSMHLIEQYNHGSAIIFRGHHCVADGIALVRVLLSMTDPLNGKSEKPHIPQPPRPKSLFHAAKNYFGAMLKLIFLGPDQKTALRGPSNGTKLATWSKPIPLAEVKALGKQLDATVNDIMLTAFSGALTAYLRSRGEKRRKISVRFMIPANLRPYKEEVELGNRFGLVLLTLPIGIEDPEKRLRALHKRMQKIKYSLEAVAGFHILHVIGMLPRFLEHIIITIFGWKCTAVMTNVPGPREALAFAGSPMEKVMAWVPQGGSIGHGLSVISYRGNVMLGLATDQGIVEDPNEIMDRVYGELDKLKALAEQKTVPA